MNFRNAVIDTKGKTLELACDETSCAANVAISLVKVLNFPASGKVHASKFTSSPISTEQCEILYSGRTQISILQEGYDFLITNEEVDGVITDVIASYELLCSELKVTPRFNNYSKD